MEETAGSEAPGLLSLSSERPGSLLASGSLSPLLPTEDQARPRRPEARTLAPPAGLERTFRLDRHGRPDEVRSPKPPHQALPNPLRNPSPHQQPSHQGWGPTDSSRPFLPADPTLESLWRRALEPIPPQVEAEPVAPVDGHLQA